MTDLVRRATADDYATYTALFRELEVDDPIASADRFARDLAPRILFYERDGQAIGYVGHYALGRDGYIGNLVVASHARGARIGEALLHAAAADLRAWGASESWHLNVRVNNAPAIRLYERVGMRPAYPLVALRMTWADAERLPIAAGVTASPAAAEDDRDLERVLGVLEGQLAVMRGRPGRVLLQLRGAHREPAGVACFDPAFPGAFPFAVARPALAGALLRAVRPHARPDDTQVNLVVEHHDELVGALIAAGAEVRLRLIHYIGPLP
jgi:GNAT superfamily N-acetyltransferase